MKSERATYILNNPTNIKVMHRGRAVWIEQLEGDFAHIHSLETRERTRVPVSELMEDEPAL